MGFKNKDVKWQEVEAAGSSRLIPAGGYVAKITDVEDVESREYLRFTYDIAEGEHKGFFADDDRPYTHQFVRSYKDKAAGFMAQFLKCIERSNDGFSLDGWDNEPNDLKNMLIGVVIQREDYTNNDGEDRACMNVEGFASVSDIRNGRFKLPEPKDNRDSGAKADSAPTASNPDTSVYDADIPF